MELKSRQVYVLRLLIESEAGILIDDLLKRLGITKRTFYYDLEKLNDWLLQFRLGELDIKGQYVCINGIDTSILEKCLGKTEGYFFSVSERRSMELLYILLHYERVTISKMEEFFDVSKNTILMDVKELKEEIKNWGLTISSTVKTGYLIEGEEGVIRKLIRSQIQSMTNPVTRGAIKLLLKRSLEVLTNNEIDFFEISRCIIKQYEKDINAELFLGNLQNECMMIQVSWIRSIRGYEFNMNMDEQITLMNTVSYRSLEINVKKLEIYDIHIPAMEIYFITSLFLGIQTTDFVSQEQEDTYIVKFAQELIRNFERISCLSFADRERLNKQLSYHIRPLYYRMKYGIVSDNPLVNDIRRMYPIMYDFTRRAFRETTDEISKMLSEDELAYLCIHFASSLNEKKIKDEDSKSRKKILITGEANMSTSYLVREQLKTLLGESFQYDMATLSKAREWILDDYVLIISTSHTKGKFNCSFLVETGPIITDSGKQKIMDIIERNHVITKYDSLIRDIIQVVDDNCSEKLQTTKIYFDLFRLFSYREHGQINDSDVPFFQKLIRKNKVVSLKPGKDWKEVVFCGCRSLEGKNNAIRLIERMNNLISRKRERFYRMQPEAVLVHCPMQGDIDGAVNASVLVSKEGINCPDGESAKILVCLSTVDNYLHWSLLDEIYQYFDVAGYVDRIKELYCDKEEI